VFLGAGKMLTSEAVKRFALECGADIVGIGSMDRFEGAPKECDPRYIFPDAKAIIGLGFRIHRGLLRGIEEGTYFAGYPAMGYASINDVFAPMVLRLVGNFIEDHGYEAVLYQNTSVRLGCNVGKPVAEGMPKPDVFLHFRIAAFICGMGEIGYSKLLLTPQFGPRQRFAFIITDAPLEPDPLFEGGLCDRCMLCAEECPAGAISKTKTVKVKVAGREIEWGELDEAKCAAVYQVGTPKCSPFLDDEAEQFISQLIEGKTKMNAGEAFSRAKSLVAYSRNAWESYHHPSAICGGMGCIRACMVHLESQGKLKNKFQSPFRRRKPWWRSAPWT